MVSVPIARWSNCLWLELFEDVTGERRPVTILHVDDALFARALLRINETASPAEAREAFLAAFPGRVEVQRWLTGSRSPDRALVALLLLCCLSASEAADCEENAFRRRMRELMGWDDEIINCEALPSLWRRLAQRTVAAGAAGRPIRPLALPDPRHRKQIGHAIELTFPSRNDARALRTELGAGGFDVESPRAVLDWIEPLVARGRFSASFTATFKNFKRAWLDAERALADHRFWSGWRLVTRDLQAIETTPFEIVADEWGARHIIDPASGANLDFETGLRRRDFPAGVLVAAARRHLVPLIAGDWGALRWARTGERASAALIRERAFRGRQDLRRIEVAGAEGWALTFDVALANNAAAPQLDRDRLIEVTLVDVIRVDGGVLARPAFPFLIEASGFVAEARLTGPGAEQVTLERIGPGRWRARAQAALDADLELEIEPRSGGAPYRRAIRLRRGALAPSFRDQAPDRLAEITALPFPFWPCEADAPAIVAPAEGGSAAPAQGLLDLIEWLAIRAAPTPIARLLEAVQGVARNAWDVIQALLDAGAIRAFETRGWRGRLVLARGPSAALTCLGQRWVLTFEGVLNESFIARLNGAASQLGVARETLFGVGAWSPPTERATHADQAPLLELANMLEAPVGALRATLSPTITALRREPLDRIEPRELSRVIAIINSSTRIAMLDDERANLPPVFKVTVGDRFRFWRDRDDAMLDAELSAGHRPFRLEGDQVRVARARLPSDIARWIRLTSGVAAGPIDDVEYGYARSDAIELALRALRPGLFERAASARDIIAPRGRWRALAIGDGVVAPAWAWARRIEGPA